MEIFKLVGSIFIDTEKANNSIAKTDKQVEGLGGKLGNGIKSAAKWGTALAAGAAAAATGLAVAIGKSSVETGRQFDKSMSQVAATMGKTMAELRDDVATTTVSINGETQKFTGNLEDFARLMGEKTAFSAKEAADGLNYMALAGYDVKKSMDMLPSVLNLAAAGNMDLAKASDMVTDAQTALGLSDKETNTLVDQMAKTASKSNTNVEQLGEATLMLGANARGAKNGTEELNSVLGVLADNGIKGREAGTHYRNMILALSGPKSTAAEAAMESIGMSFDDMYDSAGNMKDMREIMLSLDDAMAGLTSKDRKRVLTKIFNKTDLASVNALLGTSKKRWDSLGKAIKNSKGAAEEMANTQLDNLDGDITLFKSALEGAQITISKKLTPSIRKFVQFGTAGLGDLNDAMEKDGFGGAIETLGNLIGDAIGDIAKHIPDAVKAGGDLLRGVFKGFDAARPELLQAITDLINMGIDLIGDISFDEDDGAKFVTAVSNFLSGINWSGLAVNLVGLAEGIFDALVNALVNFGADHPEAGAAISTALIGFLAISNNARLANRISKALAPFASQVMVGFLAALAAAFAGFSFGKWLGDNYLASDKMKEYQVDFKLSDFLKFDDDDWDDFWQAFADWWVDVEGWWSKKFSGMKKKVSGWVSNIGGAIKNAINTHVIDLINSGLHKINKATNVISKIPGVSIGKIDDIPHLAKGGTVTQSGVVQVGETGPELLNLPKGSAVTPINSQNNALSGVEVSLETIVQLLNYLITAVKESGSGADGEDVAIKLNNREFARLVRKVVPV